MASNGQNEGVERACTSEEEVYLDAAANQIFDELVEDIVLGIAFEIHRETKMGGIPVMSEEDTNKLSIVDDKEKDIFGLPLVMKPQLCYCSICGRKISASIFAPHLAKCLGFGRKSARIASQPKGQENTFGEVSSNSNFGVGVPEKPKPNKKVDGKKKKENNKAKTNKKVVEKNKNKAKENKIEVKENEIQNVVDEEDDEDQIIDVESLD